MPVKKTIDSIPQDKLDSLIDWIESGKTLRAWCRISGNPSKSAVYRREAIDEEFSGRIARAREIGHDAIAEETLEISDEMPICEVPDPDGGVSKRIDAAGIQRNRLRVDTRLKLLAKWNPRKYGDKTLVTGPEGNEPVKAEVTVKFV